MAGLEVSDPLAHRALQALVRAESAVRRRLAADIEREGLSAAGFSVLVLLQTAGGELELRALRRRMDWSRANATEVVGTLESRRMVGRRRLVRDRRAAVVALTPAGADVVARLFPAHAHRVHSVFASLDEGEKRSLTLLCRKLAA